MSGRGTILITGGAGFIGCNTASRFVQAGRHVVVLDDLSRQGADANLEWLRSTHGDVVFEKVDVADERAVLGAFERHPPETVIHLAAQVAVTTSVTDPRMDFRINALGTFNVLEAARRVTPEARFINASTNKVYGHLDDVTLNETERGYELPDRGGIGEDRPLDFYSPYGCSKGAADQYTLDYARIFGLRTVSLRQSCIYGRRQFGIEDQGWVAWFTIAHVTGKPITIYGNGKQVRDLLFVDDLVDCYARAEEKIDDVSGAAFNVGGGPANALSLLDFLDVLGRLSGRPVKFEYDRPRPGDQPLFICDIGKAQSELGWQPTTSVTEGLETLYRWVFDNHSLFG